MRGTSGDVDLRLDLQRPAKLTTLTKPPFLGRELFFNSGLQGKIKGFLGEKDRISLTAVKKNHNFLIFLFLKPVWGPL